MKKTNHHSYGLNDAISEVYQVYAPEVIVPQIQCTPWSNLVPYVLSRCAPTMPHYATGEITVQILDSSE